MGKALGLIEHAKNYLWSFMLEISRWMMPHVWVDQLKLTVIKSRHWEQSMLYHEGRQLTYSKYPNQWRDFLKESKSDIENNLHQLGCFVVWIPHMLSGKKNLKHHLLGCISTCDSLLTLTKTFCILFWPHLEACRTSLARDQTCAPCSGSTVLPTGPPGKFQNLVFKTNCDEQWKVNTVQ